MKLRVKNTVLIGFAFLSIMLLWAGYNWFVPLFLNDRLEKLFITWLGNESLTKFYVGAVMGLDNLLALFMIPFVSKMSDRTNTRFGKRMPFIFVGLPVAAIAFALLPLAAKGSLVVLILLLLLIMVAMNFYRSPAVALMPDITPKPLRERGNAIINIMGGIGTGLGYLAIFVFSDKIIDTPMFVPIEIISFIMAICLVILVFFVKENEFKKQMYEDVRVYCEKTGEDPSFYTGKSDDEEGAVPEKEKTTEKDKKNMFVILTAILFFYMATNAVESFMSNYSIHFFGSQTLGLVLFAALAGGNFVFVLPSTVLAEKAGRKNAMLIGSGLMTLSVSSLIFVKQFSWLLLIPFFLFGIGMAIMVTNMYPTVVSYCSKGDYARFTGYYYSSTMLAQSITPALAGFFMTPYFGGGTGNLMPYATVFSLLCFVALLFVSKESNDKYTEVK